ncbi:MAG: SGNH/GDSL hydrolase family protein [Veillonella sp.]|uniref:SGNH/GDSL hydrolase family protein n=1 Tax=Veillonella sp. TaxID=1926307 RepID=UPI0025DB2D2F|nr:SGNH/GDSL hydrolase family protein [Veillonella sp.]MBS4913139.1 SGNH/GDSL hydrolase family protein [Veillonella sp.]
MNILFIGDSLTRGYDVPYGLGWVELTAKDLEAHKKPGTTLAVTNAGVDGASLQAIYNNLERCYSGSFEGTIYGQSRSCGIGELTKELSFDIVFIMGGTNDILQGRDAEYCLKTLLKSIQYIRARGAQIIMGIPPHIDWDPDGDNAIIQAYRDKLLEYCRAHHMLFIDFYKTLRAADDRKEIIYDGDVHPNELGYRYMYEIAAEVIRPLV